MENNKKNAFESRLRTVLAERKQYAWGESIGATRGSTNRMFKGEIPGWEILVAICDIERTNLNWLLYGIGQPFIVRGCRKHEEVCIQALDELYQRHGDWRIHCITQGTHYCLGLTRQARRMTRDKEVEYTEVQLITDGGGHRLLKRVEQTDQTVYRVPIPSDDFERLAQGKIGNIELLETINRSATKASRTLVPAPPPIEPASPSPRKDPISYNLARLKQGKYRAVESMIREMLQQQGDRWEELS